MRQIRIDDAWRQWAEHALGEGLGTCIFADGGTSETDRFANATQTLASEMASTYLIIPGLAPSAAIGSDLGSRNESSSLLSSLRRITTCPASSTAWT